MMRAPRKTPRERLEAAIERAIAALDTLDGDADFEPEADCCEACDDSLAPIPQGLTVAWVATDPSDDEPDLGWTPDGVFGNTDDREAVEHAL